MKIRSLLLGSVAAAGLSTGAYAADPQGPVLTTLDLCDALGLTGLTVSSDNNCLQVSGEVKYEFVWGDYKGSNVIADVAGGYDDFSIIDDDVYNAGYYGHAHSQDWGSKVEAYLKVVGTADTAVGPAVAVIKLKDIDQTSVRNENNFGPNDIPDGDFHVDALGLNAGAGADGVFDTDDDEMIFFGDDGVRGGGDDVAGLREDVLDDHSGVGGDDTGGFVIDEAYVAIGGATVLSAGKKGSILQKGDDEPFNWLGLFLSEKVDAGVYWTKDLIGTGGHVIQLVHDFGNGLSGGIGLEKLDVTNPSAGTAVGVLWYAGDAVTAHVSLAADGILSGGIEDWGVHAGITGTFDILKVRGAIAADSTGYWNALGSAEVTFDMFKLAWSGEAANAPGGTDYGVGASLGVSVTDGVTLNLGGRYYSDADGPDGYQVAGQVVAAVTEALTLTGEVGVYGTDAPMTNVYGAVTLAYAPGGGFTTSLKGEVSQNGAYRATFKAGKTID